MLTKNYKVMKKYLVVNSEDGNDFYIVDDLKELIEEMYEFEFELVQNEESFESVSEKFYSFYQVFEINGEIKALN
jgi:uncharacterized protein YxjI